MTHKLVPSVDESKNSLKDKQPKQNTYFSGGAL